VFGSTIAGDFPPSSSVRGVRCSAAAFATMRATVPFPVYVTGRRKTVSYANRRSTGRGGARTVIPFQLEDVCDFGYGSVDDAIGRWIEIFGEEIGQERRDRRADLGWFEQGWASGGYGTDERLQAENNGVVPGPLHTCDTHK